MKNLLQTACILGVFITPFTSNTWTDGSHIGEGVKSLPIFDAHMHYIN